MKIKLTKRQRQEIEQLTQALNSAAQPPKRQVSLSAGQCWENEDRTFETSPLEAIKGPAGQEWFSAMCSDGLKRTWTKEGWLALGGKPTENNRLLHRKIGRPPRSTSPTASNPLQIRLTQDERETLDRAAEKEGVRVSEYVREKAMKAARNG